MSVRPLIALGLLAAVAAAPAATPAPADEQFALKVAASDKFEIVASKPIATTATEQSTKTFAAQMIVDHTRSTEKLAAIAASLKPPLTLRAEIDAEQKATLDQLRLATGSGVDKEFLDAQIAAHTKALALLKDYAATGKEPKLKAFAEGLIPTVAGHLEMAKKLRAAPAG